MNKFDKKIFGDFNYLLSYEQGFYDNYIENFKFNKSKKYFYKFSKRFFDILMSFIMLICFSPIFLCIAVAIKLDSKGPIIFKQDRVGKNGKVFKCYKFRSMYVEAPKNCATSLLENAHSYQTKVGTFLRRLSLDELPQLWCVFIGKMSFIGYRPLIVNEKKCNDMRMSLGVFNVRPGISGYAQVLGRDDIYYKNKAIIDALYVKKSSLLFDIIIVFRTILVVLNRTGNQS